MWHILYHFMARQPNVHLQFIVLTKIANDFWTITYVFKLFAARDEQFCQKKIALQLQFSNQKRTSSRSSYTITLENTRCHDKISTYLGYITPMIACNVQIFQRSHYTPSPHTQIKLFYIYVCIYIYIYIHTHTHTHIYKTEVIQSHYCWVHLRCGQTNHHQQRDSQNEWQHMGKTMRAIQSDFTARSS